MSGRKLAVAGEGGWYGSWRMWMSFKSIAPCLLLVGLLDPVCVRATAPSTTLAHFSNTSLGAVKVDSLGNIYLAGVEGVIGSSGTYDVFIAKLSPDGSKIFYSTKLMG